MRLALAPLTASFAAHFVWPNASHFAKLRSWGCRGTGQSGSGEAGGGKKG